jgi:hypothetical protein
MASLVNIIENPHVGIFFGDFYRSTVGLHVNGSACLPSTDEVSASLTARRPGESLTAEFTASKRPTFAVQNTYHCSNRVTKGCIGEQTIASASEQPTSTYDLGASKPHTTSHPHPPSKPTLGQAAIEAPPNTRKRPISTGIAN